MTGKFRSRGEPLPEPILRSLEQNVFGWEWEDGGLNKSEARYFWHNEPKYKASPSGEELLGWLPDLDSSGSNHVLIFNVLPLLSRTDVLGNVGISFGYDELVEQLLNASDNLDNLAYCEEEKINLVNQVKIILEKLEKYKPENRPRYSKVT